MAFWNRKGSIEEEEAEFDAWLAEVREPADVDQKLQRLEIEIRIKRDDVLNKIGQRYVRPRTVKIVDIRHDTDVLVGMVISYLYASGHWNNIPAITTVDEQVNAMSVMYLNVDLLNILGKVYPATDKVTEINLEGTDA